MKIGIFDSGLGGLTVLSELIKVYPNNEYYYYGDNKNVPYGDKSNEQLKTFANRMINFLLEKNVDIIIIACGTISSNILNDLNCKVPIFDIISSTIDYINESYYKDIGVIATVRTIESKTFNKRITRNIKAISCPLLAQYIENNFDCDMLLKEYLKDLKNVDALILGCTHYPLVMDNIKKYTTAKIINMGQILSERIFIKSGHEFKLNMYFTKLNSELNNQIKKVIYNEYTLEGV